MISKKGKTLLVFSAFSLLLLTTSFAQETTRPDNPAGCTWGLTSKGKWKGTCKCGSTIEDDETMFDIWKRYHATHCMIIE